MTLPAYLFAICALLLTPGPSNTLMFLAGAQRGFRAALRLVPAELLGYLTTITPLAWLGAQLFAHWPFAATGLKMAAALWVLLLAISLWKVSDRAAGPVELTARKVYVTTVLNPKALIVGLVLLPVPGDAQFILKFGLFFAVAGLVAGLWNFVGVLSRIGMAGPRRLQIMQRTASVWLTVVSFTLIAGTLRT